jgi:hypothetical protein
VIKAARKKLQPLLSVIDYSELDDFIERAFDENVAGTLTKHLNDDWTDHYTFRYGKKSVLGTVVEYIVKSKDPSFVPDHTKEGQVTNCLDGRIYAPSERRVTIKQLNNKLANGGMRIGDDYVPPHSTADLIMFGDIFTFDVYVFDFHRFSQYHNDHAPPGIDNRYHYKPLDEVLAATKGYKL